MRGQPKVPFSYVENTPPAVDSGTTEYFVGGETRSIGRKTFDSPRPMVAYVFWDPYKNNPGPTAPSSTEDSGGNTIFALGRLKIGNQSSIIEFNFDIPWGQFLRIPVTADQLELTARLVRPTAISGVVTYQEFNDPPELNVAPLHLPDANTQFPLGFVAISGGIGEGASTPPQVSPLTRTRFLDSMNAATQRSTPIAWGARRVIVLGSSLGGLASVVLGSGGGSTGFCPVNTLLDLPNGTTSVTVRNDSAGNSGGYAVIFELGL